MLIGSGVRSTAHMAIGDSAYGNTVIDRRGAGCQSIIIIGGISKAGRAGDQIVRGGVVFVPGPVGKVVPHDLVYESSSRRSPCPHGVVRLPYRIVVYFMVGRR